MKDAASGTEGLIYTTCTSAGFVVTINEACRTNDYNGILSTLFYVGSSSSACQFATLVSGNYVLDATALAFSNCDITSTSSGGFTTYSANINFDSTGLNFQITTGVITCTVEDATPSNAVATQITGWQYEFPDYTTDIDAWDGTGMPTIVTMSHNIVSNNVNLGDIVEISISEVITGVFNYRNRCLIIVRNNNKTIPSINIMPVYIVILPPIIAFDMSQIVTYCHTLSQIVTYCHILSHFVPYCHILSHIVTYCHILPHFVTYCHI